MTPTKVGGMLNQAVDRVRKTEHRVLSEAGDDRLAGTKYVWLYGWENQPPTQQERFDQLRGQRLKTGRAWALKEMFRDFLGGGDGGRGGVFIAFREHDCHSVGRQHLQRAGQGRHGKRMRLQTEKQRAVSLFLPAVETNGPADGKDVVLVKSTFEGGPAMAEGADGHPLDRHSRVGRFGIVSRDQFQHVDQCGWVRRFSCKRTDIHFLKPCWNGL